MRLIDADALKEQFEETHQFYLFSWGGDFSKMPIRWKAACDELVNCIAEVVNAPTINAVPVVHCKDCKYSTFSEDVYPRFRDKKRRCACYKAVRIVADDDYCSWGERKDDNED